MSCRISVVVPIRDEVENLVPLHSALDRALSGEGDAVEYIYVNDGSQDGSDGVLFDLAKDDPRVRILRLDRPHGQSAALDAGVRAVRGEITIMLDGDLQNDPADLPRLLAALENADAVNGIRVRRRDRATRRLVSKAANRFRRALLPDAGQDEGCTLRVVRTPWLRRIRRFDGMHRFIPSLLRLEGARVLEIEVTHRERTRGRSKYGILRRSLLGVADAWAVRWMYARKLDYEARELGPAEDAEALAVKPETRG